MRKFALGAALALVAMLSRPALPQETGMGDYAIDPVLGFSTGPAIGEQVPDFSLPDQSGEKRRLSEMLGENGAILNFHRSADW